MGQKIEIKIQDETDSLGLCVCVSVCVSVCVCLCVSVCVSVCV